MMLFRKRLLTREKSQRLHYLLSKRWMKPYQKTCPIRSINQSDRKAKLLRKMKKINQGAKAKLQISRKNKNLKVLLPRSRT
jgi:hypothetical protein